MTKLMKTSVKEDFKSDRFISAGLLRLLHSGTPGSDGADSTKRLTVEAEAVLHGGVGGRRRRGERQGEGLQGGAHDTH